MIMINWSDDACKSEISGLQGRIQGGGGAGGLGLPFFSANALAHGEGVAPCHVMCTCACTSERFL